MVHRDRTRYNIADLTIAAYNVTKDVLTSLHHLVSSDNDKVCIASAQALAALKHPSSQAFILDAMVQKPHLAKELIVLAAEFKTEAMVNRLYDRLGSEKNPEIKSLLISSVGSFEMSMAIQALHHFASDEDEQVRVSVAKALGHQQQAKKRSRRYSPETAQRQKQGCCYSGPGVSEKCRQHKYCTQN